MLKARRVIYDEWVLRHDYFSRISFFQALSSPARHPQLDYRYLPSFSLDLRQHLEALQR
jgi:hypothetical protein